MGLPLEAKKNVTEAIRLFPTHEPTLVLKRKVDALFHGI